MDRLYIVMPAYNEEKNIEGVVKQWYPVLEGKDEDSKLVVADAGSSDSTHDILVEMQKTYPQLEILEKSEKQHGPKLIALYKYAIEQGADYIFQTDSDGQTDPAEFPPFWDQRSEYDLVMGNRAVRGDGKIRKFVENVVCLLLNLYFGVKAQDANAPFRLMKADIVNKYIDLIPEDYNIPNIILTAFFLKYKEKLHYIIISFKPRTQGKNSINMGKIIKIGIKALKDFSAFKKIMKESPERIG